MSITPTEAANVINYLLAAGAITVVDHQADVWADYLNEEIDPEPQELLPATRLAIRTWSSNDRQWKVDVDKVRQAIISKRTDRINEAQSRRIRTYLGNNLPNFPRKLEWEAYANKRIARGDDYDDAVSSAWKHIGMDPVAELPPVDPREIAETKKQIAGLLDGLASRNRPQMR